MSSMELHSLNKETQPLVDGGDPLGEINEDKVETSFGKVKVSIYGNRKRHPLVTFHDLGLDSESNFQNFFQFGSIAEFTDKFCIYNINAPGQAIDSDPLPDNYIYPTMDGLAKIVKDVFEHYKLKSAVLLGVGLGANVLLRFALANEDLTTALVLINCTTSKAGWIEWGYQKMNMRYLRQSGMTAFTVDYLMWHHFGRRLDQCSDDIVRQYRVYFQHLPNPNNLALLTETYVNRSEIQISRDGLTGPKLNVPVMQIVGTGSAFVNDSVELNAKLDPSKSDWIKVSDSCGLVLDDRPDVVTESFVLFLQGLGYFPLLNAVKLTKRIQDAQNGSFGSSISHSSRVDEC